VHATLIVRGDVGEDRLPDPIVERFDRILRSRPVHPDEVLVRESRDAALRVVDVRGRARDVAGDGRAGDRDGGEQVPRRRVERERTLPDDILEARGLPRRLAVAHELAQEQRVTAALDDDLRGLDVGIRRDEPHELCRRVRAEATELDRARIRRGRRDALGDLRPFTRAPRRDETDGCSTARETFEQDGAVRVGPLNIVDGDGDGTALADPREQRL
jgi:hypothetical protein